MRIFIKGTILRITGLDENCIYLNISVHYLPQLIQNIMLILFLICGNKIK